MKAQGRPSKFTSMTPRSVKRPMTLTSTSWRRARSAKAVRFRVKAHHHALLGFGHPDLPGVQAGIFQGDFFQPDLHPAGLLARFAPPPRTARPRRSR